MAPVRSSLLSSPPCQCLPRSTARSPPERTCTQLHFFSIHDLLFHWSLFSSIDGLLMVPISAKYVCKVSWPQIGTLCVSLSLFSVISIIPSLSEYLMPARPSPKFCQRLCQKPLSFTAPASHFVPGTALKRNFLWFQMKASLSSNGEQGAALTSLHLGFQLRRNYPKTLYSSQLPPPSTPPPTPGFLLCDSI